MEALKTGTTTVGIVAKDAVIIAADRRGTAGGYVFERNITKVHLINDRLAVTIAGVVSDIQLLLKYIRAEIKIKELKTGLPTTVKEAANLIAGFNYSGLRMQGSVAQFLLAGRDGSGTHLYQITFDGVVRDVDDYDVTGSGSILAMGVLDSQYKPGMSEAQAIELMKQVLKVALGRDTASGNGYDIFVVDAKGITHKEAVRLKLTE